MNVWTKYLVAIFFRIIKDIIIIIMILHYAMHCRERTYYATSRASEMQTFNNAAAVAAARRDEKKERNCSI